MFRETSMSTHTHLKVLLLATAVRVLILGAAVTFDAVLPDYDSSVSLLTQSCKVFGDLQVSQSAATERLTAVTARGALAKLAVWDSVFFVRIAKCGYEYEQFHAFFPLLPLTMRAVLLAGLSRFSLAAL